MSASLETVRTWRRRALTLLIFIPAVLAAHQAFDLMPAAVNPALQWAIVLLFGVLIAWVSAGFWTAVMGFWSLLRGRDPYALTRGLEQRPLDYPLAGRTALVMPIYHEDVAHVFAGLEATYRSLAGTGQLGHFDLYILSDSKDPDQWVREELAWATLCRNVQGFERIFYRRRRVSTKRKSGNVADFCRRWGRNYDYMVVLDADSVMSGATLVRLAQLMDAHPQAGMIQTLPAVVGRSSLFARLQQFAGFAYGRLFAAGLNFWQLGEAHYWGHNVIIRVAPFMAHCGLPRLRGTGPLAGDILSHDFAEAALMRRAGYEVWLAPDLPGSYEEGPPTLVDALIRERRWCQGNMQHSRLLVAAGIHPVHRAMFVTGIMAYASAPLWLLLLLLSSVAAVQVAGTEVAYFGTQPGLFPHWPVSQQPLALTLFGATLILLFVPKLLALGLLWRDPALLRKLGGRLRLAGGVLLESLASMLIAPVRMLVHSRFVVMTLLGRTIQWGTQRRGDHAMRWREAFSYHAFETVAALVWGGLMAVYAPAFFWWLTPVLAGWLLAAPLSVWTSSGRLGERLRRSGLLLTPEEADPPVELRELPQLARGYAYDAGFLDALVDPVVNALHLSLLQRGAAPSRRPWVRRAGLVDKVLTEGPETLDQREKTGLLSDAASLLALHRRLWQPDADGRVRALDLSARPA